MSSWFCTRRRSPGRPVHYVELDQFVGPNFLVTTHGPLNPAVEPAAATIETESLKHRLESGRLRPKASYELSPAWCPR